MALGEKKKPMALEQRSYEWPDCQRNLASIPDPSFFFGVGDLHSVQMVMATKRFLIFVVRTNYGGSFEFRPQAFNIDVRPSHKIPD